jgi:hypothetical protein
MAITFTKKTLLVYGNGWTPEVFDWIHSYGLEKAAEGKTDGEFEQISDTTTVRLWVDEASAQDFVDKITASVLDIGRPDISVSITDI